MSKIRVLIALLFGLAVLLLPACGADRDLSVQEGTVLIDVRSTEEFAVGHLEGAINLDLNSGNFEQEVQLLDKSADYIVYCRSGNRSSQAKRIMDGLGFEQVRDAGGIEAATKATGVEVVTY